MNPFRKVSRKNVVQWTLWICLIIIKILSLALLIICYICLATTLWKVFHGKIRRSSNKKASCGVIKITLLIFSTLLTYAPFTVLQILAVTDYKINENIAEWVIIVCTPFNAIVSPIVTAILQMGWLTRIKNTVITVEPKTL